MKTWREQTRDQQVEAQTHRLQLGDLRPAHYVVRVQNAAFNGWRFQKQATGDAPLVQAYFSCVRFGGEVAALAAANEFAGQHRAHKLAYGAHSKNRRNPFGFVGVYLRKEASRSGAISSVSWVANWTEAGLRQVRMPYPINVYGYRGAFLNAAWERIRAVGEQPCLDPNSPPEPPDWVAAWMSRQGIS